MELNYENLVSVLTFASKSEKKFGTTECRISIEELGNCPWIPLFTTRVYLNTDLPLQIRWLAIICFKNGVDKYWKSSRSNSIQKQEKQQIIAKSMDLINEKNNQLMLQNAYSISKIARFDFPWIGQIYLMI